MSEMEDDAVLISAVIEDVFTSGCVVEVSSPIECISLKLSLISIHVDSRFASHAINFKNVW